MFLREMLAPYGLDGAFFASVAACGLTLAIVIEHGQTIVKYYGVQKQKIASSYNAAMKLMLFNRLGSVLYFLFGGLAVDLGVTVGEVSERFVVSIIAIAVADGFVAWKIFAECRARLTGLEYSAFAGLVKPGLMSFVASMFSVMGLTLPIMLSASFPDLRLTLANSGFVLNAVFSVLTVFFVESYLAKLIDRRDELLGAFVVLVFVTRVGASLACIPLVLKVTLILARG